MLTKEQIEKFQTIYREEYGINLSHIEAETQGLKLLANANIMFSCGFSFR